MEQGRRVKHDAVRFGLGLRPFFQPQRLTKFMDGGFHHLLHLDAIRDGLPTDLPDTGFKTTVRSPCRIRAMAMLARSGRGSHDRGALATCPEFYGGGPVLPIRLARNWANGLMSPPTLADSRAAM
jgi:hypothetical protein